MGLNRPTPIMFGVSFETLTSQLPRRARRASAVHAAASRAAEKTASSEET
jgi:hypothetical protein